MNLKLSCVMCLLATKTKNWSSACLASNPESNGENVVWYIGTRL